MLSASVRGAPSYRSSLAFLTNSYSSSFSNDSSSEESVVDQFSSEDSAGSISDELLESETFPSASSSNI